MIVNAYSVVAAFTSAIELLLGIVAVAGALRLRTGARARDSAPALFLPGIVLAALAASSIPLLWVLLASYVPQWPGVMCVTGVLRIGTGSRGASGWLPALLTALVVTKPLLLVATGSWIALHIADRRSRTAPLTGKVVLLLGASGVLAVVDAAVELAYLVIPKQERFLDAGCCIVRQSATLDAAVGGPPARAALALGASAVVATIAAFASRRLLRSAGPAGISRAAVAWTVAAAVAAAAAVPAAWTFLADALSPSHLRLTSHACAQCLLDRAPEYGTVLALAIAGAAAAASAAVVVAAARGTEAAPPACDVVARVLGWASFALPAAAVVAFSGWWFA